MDPFTVFTLALVATSHLLSEIPKEDPQLNPSHPHQQAFGKSLSA